MRSAAEWQLLGLWWMVGLAALAGLHRLGCFRDPLRERWRAALVRGGFLDRRPWAERRLGSSRGLLRPGRHLFDIERWLGLAGSGQTPAAWALRTISLALLIGAAGLAIDRLLVASGEGGLPPVLLIQAVVGGAAARYLGLRATARARQAAAGREVEDMLPRLALLMARHATSVEVAVVTLARCQRGGVLLGLLTEIDEDLARPPHRRQSLLGRELAAGLAGGRGVEVSSAATLYRLAGQVYGVAALEALGAEVGKMRSIGLSAEVALGNLGGSVLDSRLAAERLREARARIAIAAPTAALLVPLMLMVAGPVGLILIRQLGSGQP